MLQSLGSSPARNTLARALSSGVSDRSALPTRRGARPIAAASALPSDAPLTLSMARRNQDAALSPTARTIHSSAKARKPSQTVAATSPLPLRPERLVKAGTSRSWNRRLEEPRQKVAARADTGKNDPAPMQRHSQGIDQTDGGDQHRNRARHRIRRGASRQQSYGGDIRRAQQQGRDDDKPPGRDAGQGKQQRAGQNGKRPQAADVIQVFLLCGVGQSNNMCGKRGRADDQGRNNVTAHRCASSQIHQRPTQAHDDGCKAVALVPDVVKHDGDSQRQAPDRSKQTERRQQRNACRKQRESDGRYGGCANVAGVNRPAWTLPGIDLPVEKIIEIHPTHVECGHGKSDGGDVGNARSSICDRCPGNDIGPYSRQVGHPTEPQQGLRAGCSHDRGIHPTSSWRQNAISRAMSADFEPVRTSSGRTSQVYVSTSKWDERVRWRSAASVATRSLRVELISPRSARNTGTWQWIRHSPSAWPSPNAVTASGRST